MNEYLIRKATKNDLPFLADAVIAAEKGISDKLNYSTLFNLSEKEVKDLIIAMFEEEVDGCEFSVSSYLVTEYNGEPVATFGAWIECFKGCMPSKILKSNLINYTFGKESIEFLKTKSHIVKDIMTERDPLTLQFEYLFVSESHRGKKLAHDLIEKLEENAISIYPALKKGQFQLFKNNVRIISLFGKHGYKVVKSYKSNNIEIFNYLPSDEKYIMEKEF
ncbi:MAG TPA: GNAT family N-acetyltransferase [Ignavibacteria bacterium]